MDELPSLPLPVDQLPEAVRKFGAPDAPGPAKTMAAKGLVPVKGNDLVTLLVQLSADSEDAVSGAATETLKGIPEGAMLAACAAPLHPSILDRLALLLADRDDALEQLVSNHETADTTVERVARNCSEAISEVVATNQQRLLGAPKIIEALYKNNQTRMSTADRLVELAARNDVELTGIPAFKQHVEAIQGQLIPEVSDEPLPDDLLFTEAVDVDEEDLDAIEQDKVDGTETLNRKYAPLSTRIADMTLSQKIRFAQIGNSAARAILVRDANRAVAYAAISAPGVGESEVARIAHSKEIADDILRFIGNKRDWVRNYEVKKALVFNPKTPMGVALKWLGHLREHDLRALSRSRNIQSNLKQAASQRVQKKQRGGGRKV